MHPRISRGALLTAAVAALGLGAVREARAHDIPPRVTVVAYLKPEGGTLRVVLRAPLEAMRDLEFPVRGPGYLELARVRPLLEDAARLWIAGSLDLRENDRSLGEPRVVAARVSLPSDRSFASYETALAHATGQPLDPAIELIWRQALLDVVLDYAIDHDRASFSLRPTLARLGLQTTTVLRFLPPGRGERAYQFTGDPGLVRLDPRWYQAAFRFVALGVRHILDGFDHLLFVFCLVIPIRRLRPLLAVITAFTLAHSVTLAASTLGLAPQALWFPPLIELLIALSIVYMAFENIVGPKLERRWLLAFGFGLVHGFGFSFFLRDSLQFAGAHLATSLLSFNVGVELGQLVVLAVAVPALALLFRRVVAERMGTILLSALVAHSAWHWMTDRWSVLRQYRFQWPGVDLAAALRALLLLALVAGAAWVMVGLARRLRERTTASAAAEAGSS